MKLAAVSADWEFQSVRGRKTLIPGGTNWIRMHVPAVELRKHGYSIVAGRVESAPDGHFRVQDYEGEWHDDCDLIWMQRSLPQPIAEGPAMVARAVASGQVVVNDIDDHHWALSPTVRARLDTGTYDKGMEHYRGVLRASSAVIASTALLHRVAEKLNGTAFLCRNAIDLDRWNFDKPGGFMGWVGPVVSHGGDLPILRESVIPFMRTWGIPFYHGGNDPTRPINRAIGYEDVVTRDLCSPHEYPSLWAPLGVAFIPLEDSTFNRAKSWLKGMEACARGIPFIASRLPEYEPLSGRLAKKRSEWHRHLIELADPEVRAAEGAANRKRAEELSIANQWGQWADVFSALLPVKSAGEGERSDSVTDGGRMAEDGSRVACSGVWV